MYAKNPGYHIHILHWGHIHEDPIYLNYKEIGTSSYVGTHSQDIGALVVGCVISPLIRLPCVLRHQRIQWANLYI